MGGENIQSSNRNALCIVCMVICAALWAFAPFVAINLLTMGDQPSALDFITDNILYIGELTESLAFWAAVGSLIGIIICFFCATAKKRSAVHTTAILTELPMLCLIIEMFLWADDMEEFSEVFGFGFWCILVLFLVVIAASGKNTQTWDP